MDRLLTIAIPTFNRSNFLDRQLAWLAKSIEGFQSECEIIISDNNSSDNTKDIINKWRPAFGDAIFRLNVNSENIGPVRNIALCINLATSKYVWVVGDDDDLKQETVAYVFQNLQDNPELSLLVLNYSVYYAPDNKVICDRRFPIKNEEVRIDGKVFLEELIAEMEAVNGFGLISALVYRRKDVNAAISKWQQSLYNIEAPGYWSGFCATRGSLKISTDVYLQYNSGMNTILSNKQWFGSHYSHLPQIYVKLMESGYDKKLLTKLILKHFKESNLKVILGAFRRWPILSLNVIIPYLILVGVSAYSQFKLSITTEVNPLSEGVSVTR